MFFHRLLFQSLAGWFVRGCLFGHPPTPPRKFRGKPLKTPKKPPAYATRRALTAGCSFCPFGGRNASAAAEQMRWSFLLGGLNSYAILIVNWYQYQLGRWEHYRSILKFRRLFWLLYICHLYLWLRCSHLFPVLLCI